MRAPPTRAVLPALRRARILWGVRRHPLPEGLRVYHSNEKLIWQYIERNGEDVYTARGLADELGTAKMAANSALTKLRRNGWLVELRAPVGPHGGIYRAVRTPAKQV